MYEEWYQPHPERIVPLGITYLADPEAAAAEIRRNAERGFTAVTLPERPHASGCRRSSTRPLGPDRRRVRGDRHRDLPARRLSGIAESPPGCADRCSSAPRCSASCRCRVRRVAVVGLSVKHPDLKIAMAEGGIGWVAMLLDRLDNIVDRSGYGARLGRAARRRAAPQLLVLHHRRPVDDRHRATASVSTTSWSRPTTRTATAPGPTRQAVIEKAWGMSADEELRAMCSENAAALFRHPLPETVLPTGP